MPISRYRDVSEMPRPPRIADDRLVEQITKLWRRASAIAPLAIVRGVRRFATIEEANAARQAETTERMRRLARK